MTTVVAIVGPTDFEAAIAHARSLGTATPLTGLAAPLGRASLARLDKAWRAVETALRCAYLNGVAAARQLIDQAVAVASELMEEAQREARELHDALLERMYGYLSVFVDRALATVRETITVGSHTLELASVELEQSISLSGSLKLSIQEVCGVSGSGKLTLSAVYNVQAAQP